MNSRVIVVLSVVGVLGAAGAAMAVNSELLNSAAYHPIGQAAEVLAASPPAAPGALGAPTPTLEPETSEDPNGPLPTQSLPPVPTSAPSPTATPAPDDSAEDDSEDESDVGGDHDDDEPPEDDD